MIRRFEVLVFFWSYVVLTRETSLLPGVIDAKRRNLDGGEKTVLIAHYWAETQHKFQHWNAEHQSFIFFPKLSTEIVPKRNIYGIWNQRTLGGIFTCASSVFMAVQEEDFEESISAVFWRWPERCFFSSLRGEKWRNNASPLLSLFRKGEGFFISLR